MKKRGPKRKKLVDTNWSANLAYAIGLLATDGYLAKTQNLIDLTSKDRIQLVNFNKSLGLKIKIGNKNSGYKNRHAYRVQIKNGIFYDFLISIGLIPTKSKTLKALKIPDKYYFDFLRGCFDGDGSFHSYTDSRWKSSFMFYTSFASASYHFIRWIRGKNKSLLGITGYLNDRYGENIYQIKYAKRESQILFRKMYHSPNVICLPRKKLKIDKALATMGVSV